MAIYKEDIVSIELSTGAIYRSFLNHSIGSGDNSANRFGIRVFRDGSEVDLSGASCQAYFQNAEGTNIALTSYGTVSGNVAYVTLPQACYNVEGQFCLSIKLVGGGVTGTMRIIDGMVCNTGTTGAVAPTGSVPTYQEILAVYAEMQEDIADYESVVANQNGKIDDLKSILNDYIEEENIAKTADISGYISRAGEVLSNNTLSCSDFIRIPDNAIGLKMYTKYTTGSGGLNNISPFAVFFENNKTTITGYIDANSSDVSIDANNVCTYYFTNGTTKYVRFNRSRKTQDAENIYFSFVLLSVEKILSVASSANIDVDNLDLHDLQRNKLYYKNNSNHAPTNLPYNNWTGILMTLNSAQRSDAIGTFLIAISSTHRVHICRSWGSGASWSDWVELSSKDYVEDYVEDYVGNMSGALYEYHGSFTEANQSVIVPFIMAPKTHYRVRFYSGRKNRINLLPSNNSYKYRSAYPYDNECIVYNHTNVNANLKLYNISAESLDPIDIKIFAMDSIYDRADHSPNKYVVRSGADYKGDYTSLTRCLFDLKDDHSPKIIEVWEGDYDIYSEYKELYDEGLLEIYTGTNPTGEYFDYCVWVPENTHIIGKGIVRLKWMPDPNEVDITAVQCRCISPLNVAATATIENVEVYCKNGRYCLHNDGYGKDEFTGAVQRFVNVRFYKYDNDTEAETGLTFGFLHTTGFGIDRSMHHVYENCTFINYANAYAFYGHLRTASVSTEARSSDITLVNCAFITDRANLAIKLGCSTSNRNIRIRTMFNNCYISGKVACLNEGDASANCANGFDLQFLNCDTVTVRIKDPDNPYVPAGYNTTVTIEDS